MAPTESDLELAIHAYWQTKDKQRDAALAIASTAEGTAKAVRGGGHFNPIVNLIARFFTDAGYPLESIRASRKGTTLPGFYRPSKAWDLVVVHRGVLVAAIELKGLGSPSFGKNFNNRVEEALGNAVDLSRASLARLCGEELPWTGYFFVMEDQVGSERPIKKPQEGPFSAEPIWYGTSYQDRFAITGKRLLDEGLYDAVCYLVSSPEDPRPAQPVPQLDWRHFVAAVQARITYLANLGYP
jgi:hypothetical protein